MPGTRACPRCPAVVVVKMCAEGTGKRRRPSKRNAFLARFHILAQRRPFSVTMTLEPCSVNPSCLCQPGQEERAAYGKPCKDCGSRITSALVNLTPVTSAESWTTVPYPHIILRLFTRMICCPVDDLLFNSHFHLLYSPRDRRLAAVDAFLVASGHRCRVRTCLYRLSFHVAYRLIRY